MSQDIGVFNIKERIFDDKSLYFDENSPLLEYRSGTTPTNNAHWGQLKLLAVETMFLVDYYNPDIHKNPVVVYAGAAHGDHFLVLANIFKDIMWYLYDPATFNIKPTEKIKIFNQLFTNSVCIDLKKKADKEKWDLFFMSDIRLVPEKNENNNMFEESIEKDKQIEEDMINQENWHNILKPIISLLKFRIPYYKCDTNSDYYYLPGKIMVHPFSPRNSNEVRLIVTENNRKIKYASKWFDEALYYHNSIARVYYRYKPLTNNSQGLFYPSLRTDYDSMWISLMCKKYLIWYFKYIKKAGIKDMDSLLESFAERFINDTVNISYVSDKYPEIEYRRMESLMVVFYNTRFKISYFTKKFGWPELKKHEIKNKDSLIEFK